MKTQQTQVIASYISHVGLTQISTEHIEECLLAFGYKLPVSQSEHKLTELVIQCMAVSKLVISLVEQAPTIHEIFFIS